MSCDILIKYRDFPSLEIELDPSPLRDEYKNLIKQSNASTPISRDPRYYTEDRFRQLCQQAQDVLGWDWVYESYPLEVTTRLHKDIEIFLARGFAAVPEAYDDLLHDLHFALHAIQNNHDRGDWIQVEWFNDAGFSMPASFSFVRELRFGDVKLQNPYVGHDPAFVFFQQDSHAVAQTCKFHDLVRPGINLMITDYEIKVDSFYKDWFLTHAPDWVATHGWDQVLRYTGWPRVGRVKNIHVLEQIAMSDQFAIESVTVV